MNLKHQKYNRSICFIVFHLTLLYRETKYKKYVWLIFIYYILRNFDLYITYIILLFFIYYL